ncbi:amino acid adenylation domain-containing protein [Brevibacillus porteri]|uniref:Non-ribosomal peptide synthetase n=1 Tax=Brevibacillus porteri TaxID=2126350 RepID=A0ABX5FID5_9BACL|nr:non-ribosomal peptide synthetase [Brevibacillus porteri]MED1801253.1 amino acid adenylation domain-containing protein [Brevibacillus porteri]MED2129882.1 amino acid adenylation domain-containing protein [Brevibacillus porteri]MED2746811.1 amino acid adenylation domain-containing protein [Brevibacillus porteri]MED2815961.1 amino acid adenylation domain-containing protein [Brevibacillus porteri]MED2895778.1 amino acid adenylation domain-containing protein [Brevibacillus porteri]
MTMEDQVSHWLSELAGEAPLLQLPFDIPRQKNVRYEEEWQSIDLSKPVGEKARLLCMQEETDMFTLFLAAYHSYLYRYTGQNDIRIGAIASDSSAFFASRVIMGGTTNFKQLLNEVKENRMEEKLTSNSETTKLFHTFLRVGKAGDGDIKLFVDSQIAKVELRVDVEEAEGMRITFTYNSFLFTQQTIRRMIENFCNWIEQVITDVETPIDLLRLITKNQERELVDEWCRNDEPTNVPDTILNAFDFQANRNPDAIALVYKQEKMTYRELDIRSNQLANYLRKIGVTSEVLVGICQERSMEMIVSILGVLKAGGAYVPIDPAYPVQRLHYIMEDAALQVVIADEASATKVPDGIKVVKLSDYCEILPNESTEPPAMEVNGHNLAYVIYTSGSTGNPKGVMIEHHSVMNFLQTLERRSPLLQTDRLLQKTSVSFDASVWELFWWMLKGASLYILPNSDEKDPALLVKAVEMHKITHLEFVPSMLKAVLDYIENLGSSFALSSLKYVTVGGEVLPPHVVTKCTDLLTIPHGTTLYNTYGPTETTVEVASFKCHPDEKHAQIPIGKPNANTQLYVLNEHLQMQPVGVAGELYVGGSGVARGYLNRPELTEERFISNPYCPESDSRLYRTGDLVRYLADGNLEYIGRNDNQVKVRGYRIELEEIEVTLGNHSTVEQAIIVAKKDAYENNKLIAYVIGSGTVTEWRDYLKAQLPEFMVPAYFVKMDVFPLTPSGKIDLKSLPEVGNSRPHVSTEYVKPETEWETKLLDIWKDLFGYDEIGVEDNFFELGGHSLLGTQVIARIRALFKKEIPLSALFTHPTIRSIVPIVTAADEVDAVDALPAIKRVSRDRELPLSYSQERVWFLEQLSANNLAYIFQATMKVRGMLDLPILNKCFTEIVRRHEIFRTVFHEKNGQPYQVIYEPFDVELPVIDVSHLPESDRAAEVQRLIQMEIKNPIDIAQLPLARWIVYKISELESVILFVEHHLIHDGWSFRKFLKELFTLYSAYLEKKPSPLAELPIQFADYCVWQNELFKRGKENKQLTYWKNLLQGANGLLELPTDRPRPVNQTFHGNMFTQLIPEELYLQLRDYCMKTNTTLFMVMMSAFQTLLHRYSNQEDIIVGSGIANRRWKDTEELIGMFVNNIVIRTQFTDNMTFQDVLQDVKRSALEAYENQEIPFDQIVDALKLKRDQSRNPLFQVMFSFQDAKVTHLPVSNLNIQLTEGISNGSAKFDINVVVTNHEELSSSLLTKDEYGSISLDWEYNTDLYEESTMRRMFAHYIELLKSVLTHSDQTLHSMPMLTASEENQILQEWNDTEVAFEDQKTLHQIFEEQAARTPERMAVVFGNEQWTYRQINNRANFLASKLRNQGVKPDTLVGLLSERSPDMMIGILAILKAGGAYMPMDTVAPKDRLSYILRDSDTKVVVMQEKFKTAIDFNGPVLLLEENRPDQDVECENLESVAHSKNLAYVIYTSGSTGAPKGVMIEHCSVVNRMNWMVHRYPMNEDDTILQKTPYCFDVSVTELVLWFFTGSKLCFLAPHAEKDPELIVKTVAQHQITYIHFVPSMLSIFLDHLENVDCAEEIKTLQRVYTTGEALSAEQVQRFHRLIGQRNHTTLINLYGPTETTIEVTYYDCQTDSKVIPIGKPMDNIQAYILNKEGDLQPIGVMGELVIGGIGLARGYIGKPELTAERFVPNPFGNPSERLYKTGDYARWMPDGNIEYIGRMDNQVKIRGYRIELGEIEAVMRKQQGVGEVAIIAHEYEPGDKRLIAYYSGASEAETVKSHLQKQLPPYMIPSYFVRVGEMPLTSSGKLDRKALPLPEIHIVSHHYTAPRNSTEELLALIWSEILRVNQIGVFDSFFELGGHSLLATQVVSRIREVFGQHLPLRAIFDCPTIEGLAKRLTELRQGEKMVQLPALLQVDRTEPIPLSFAQQRLWFFDQLEPGSNVYNIPYVWRLSGSWDVAALETGFNQLVERHEMLRTVFAKQNGVPVQLVKPHQSRSLPVIHVSSLSADESEKQVQHYIQQSADRVFDLSQGPLIEAELIKQDESEYVLLCTVHHIVFDGWSEDILLDEWMAFYEAAVSGTPADLPPLSIQYGDFAVWQRQWLSDETMKEQVAYWENELADDLTVLQLPFDRPRPAIQTYAGDMQHIDLAPSLLEKLKAFSKQEGASLFMTLLAAYQSFLSRYTGQTDILVGSPVANRTRKEMEGLIGCFVNTLVYRVNVEDNPSFRELVAQVKEKTLRGQENQDVPFEKIVEARKPERNASYSPVFQTIFTMQTHLRNVKQWPNRKIEPVKSTIKVAKFDLSISIEVHSEHSLTISFGYNTDLFNPSSIERMIGHFVNWLEQVMAYPEESIEGLRLISEEEEKQLLEMWSNH